MRKSIATYSLYKFRYWIGYGLISLIFIALLIYAGLYAPGGISDKEVNSVIASSAIKPAEFSSYGVINMPYHILQKLSLSLFGVNNFSIKLPSLLLALVSAVGLLLLLRMWFKRYIAILGSAIAITTSQFLFIAQSGSPEILYIFWSIIILLLGILTARRHKYRKAWKMLFFAAAALSLYTPLSIYALVALFAASLLHPHLRYIIKNLSKLRLAISFTIGIILISPLLYGLVMTPDLGLRLLGIPPEWPNWANNIGILAQQYLGFATTSNTALITPTFGLGSALLIIIGIYGIIKTRQSTQSYVIIIWILCLVPIMFIEPGYTSISFLPLVLLLCIGLDRLLSYWYKLFPLNPYARVAGLVPVVILVSSLMFSGLDRYINSYTHDPNTIANFSFDLSLRPKEVNHLIVSSEEQPFYNVVAKYNNDVVIDTKPSSDVFATIRNAKASYPGYEVDEIITSPIKNESDRFYIYKLVKK